MFAIDIDRKILHHMPDRQSDSQTAGQPDESRTQMSSMQGGMVAEESKVYFQIPSLKLMIFIFGPFYLKASGITSSDGAACRHNVVLSPVT